ncbi:MAG TPA: hypothetical protein VEP49_18150 [Acidimicrobiia bacterium]|nr:hypothetical protein [Acidimicrobiia bacterium]
MTTGTASASDASQAKALLITAADVGAGYKKSTSSPSPDVFPQIAQCVGKPVTGRKVTVTVNGPDFTDQQTGAVVSSEVDFLRTAAMVKQDEAVAKDSSFPDCIASVAKQQPGASDITSITAQRVPVKKFGDYSTAVLAGVTGTSNGQTFTATVVQVGILKGRAEVQANFTTNGTQAFSQATAEKILAKVNSRLQKANVS